MGLEFVSKSETCAKLNSEWLDAREKLWQKMLLAKHVEAHTSQ